MSTPSQTNESSEARRILEGQLRECYGRVVYSHKTHEKCADILLTRHSRIKLSQILLSAITTGGFLGTIFGDWTPGAVIGAIVSAILLFLNSYTKNYDLGELAQKHRHAAADIWIIREKYLSILTDLRMGLSSVELLLVSRDELLEELYSVYSGTPSTNYGAYKKAQHALKFLEDLTFTDKEIDAFLPFDIRRVKSKPSD